MVENNIQIDPHSFDLVRAKFALWPVLHFGSFTRVDAVAHRVVRGLCVTDVQTMQRRYAQYGEGIPLSRRLAQFATDYIVFLTDELDAAEQQHCLPGTHILKDNLRLQSEQISNARRVVRCLQNEATGQESEGLVKIKNRRVLDDARRVIRVAVAQRLKISELDREENILTRASRDVVEKGLFPVATDTLANLRSLDARGVHRTQLTPTHYQFK